MEKKPRSKKVPILINKLVRDKIPQEILAEGKLFHTETIMEEEFPKALNAKLEEEVDEYLISRDIWELVDLLEVIYALASLSGVSESQLNKLRGEKLKQKGGFQNKVFLVWVQN